MNGTPASLLLESLRAFLRDELQPQLSGFTAYSNRVAANLLGILEREQAIAPVIDALDREFAAARNLPTATLQRDLARALRDGELAADPLVLAYLRRRTLLVMAINNPRYAGYRQARERWKEELPPCIQ